MWYLPMLTEANCSSSGGEACPAESSPQQVVVPSVRRPQLNSQPALMDTKFSPRTSSYSVRSGSGVP